MAPCQPGTVSEDLTFCEFLGVNDRGAVLNIQVMHNVIFVYMYVLVNTTQPPVYLCSRESMNAICMSQIFIAFMHDCLNRSHCINDKIPFVAEC